jgi:DNA-binding Lrp family transcriptional regulator
MKGALVKVYIWDCSRSIRSIRMPISGEFSIGEEIGQLDELPSANDLEILRAIGDDSDARDLSFQGIKRKLGLHQETLSRALHRLQRDGYVERLEHAYRASRKGLDTISAGNRHSISRDMSNEPYSVVLLRAILPSDLDVRSVTESLSYKWFGSLRWLGSTLAPDSATLSWITSETGLKISVRIKGDTLTIETFPQNSSSVSEATRSAFELFDHVSRALRSSDTRRPARPTNAA